MGYLFKSYKSTSLITMTNFSPAAQAVLDAFGNSLITEQYTTSGRIEIAIAAALRAVADQIQMKEPFGDTDADAGVFAAHQAIHAGLSTIAAELENV